MWLESVCYKVKAGRGLKEPQAGVTATWEEQTPVIDRGHVISMPYRLQRLLLARVLFALRHDASSPGLRQTQLVTHRLGSPHRYGRPYSQLFLRCET